MRRLTVLSLAASAVLVSGLLTGATLALNLARCYVDAIPLPLPDHHLCGSGPWGAEWVPVVVAIVSVAVAMLSVTLLVLAIRSQFGRARRLLRHMEKLEVPAPPRLAASARRVGAEGYRCVEHPLAVAITIGVAPPRIVVSDAIIELLDDVELDAVLAHEEEHRGRRDPAVFGIARMAAAAAFLVPAARQLASRLVLRSEIAADEAAVSTTGIVPLVSALTKLSDTAPDEAAMAVGSVRGMLHERVEALAGRAASRPLGVRVTTLSVLGVAAVVTPALAVVATYLRVRGLL